MNEYWLAVFANWGQLAAGICALVAAAIGMVASYASNELTKRSNRELIHASAIIERLDHQVGAVIGDAWPPLTGREIEVLSEKIRGLSLSGASAQVMYENPFGKELAENISTAFKAAGWTVSFTPGGGFEDGIVVGPGPIGVQLQEAVNSALQTSQARALRPQENANNHYFVGVGANVKAHN